MRRLPIGVVAHFARVSSIISANAVNAPDRISVIATGDGDAGLTHFEQIHQKSIIPMRTDIKS